jgi:hypothetical protein
MLMLAVGKSLALDMLLKNRLFLNSKIFLRNVALNFCPSENITRINRLRSVAPRSVQICSATPRKLRLMRYVMCNLKTCLSREGGRHAKPKAYHIYQEYSHLPEVLKRNLFFIFIFSIMNVHLLQCLSLLVNFYLFVVPLLSLSKTV